MAKVKIAIQKDECHITDTANWLMTNISSYRYPNGIEVFAIYSTENPDDPTVLYESKGERAVAEKNKLFEILEEYYEGRNVDRKTEEADKILIGDRMQSGDDVQHTDERVVRGRTDRDDRLLLGQSSVKPREAFGSVLKNLFEIQDRNRLVSGVAGGRGDGGVREYRSGLPGGSGRGLSGGRETGKRGADKLSGDSGRRRDARDGETKYILTGTGTEGDGRRADIPTGEENRWKTMPTAEKKNTGVTLSDIVKDISDKFGIPISTGKVTSREASGIYKEKP